MSTRDFTTQVFTWLDQVVSDHSMPSSRGLIAVALRFYFNEPKGGAAWPSMKTLADKTGLSERQIRTVINGLVANGHLKVIRGQSNRYFMVIRTGSVLPVPATTEPAVDCRSHPNRTGSVLPPNRKCTSGRTGSVLPLNQYKNQSIEPTAADDRLVGDRHEDDRQEHDRPPVESPPARSQAAKQHETDPVSSHESRPPHLPPYCAGPPSSPPEPYRFEEEFAEFWRACPRKDGWQKARRAYEEVMALAEFVDAEDVLAGMRRYAEQCQGREQRYIKLPANWLEQRRWDEEARRPVEPSPPPHLDPTHVDYRAPVDEEIPF